MPSVFIHLFVLLCQVARMKERTVHTPVAGISPVQQMLASGSGALLTSLFGEINYPINTLQHTLFNHNCC